jgi:nucleotide-binding universal stress UspA family protein
VKAPPADADSAAVETANALAAKLGATIVDSEADLVVVGSSPTGPEGRISLSGQSRSQLNSGTGSVLVVPRAKPVAL